jgi:chemotaxis protein methyltransferase CheR
MTMADDAQVGGEFRMSTADFRQISAIMHAETGVLFDDSKINLVYSRLAKRLRLLQLQSFSEYCELVGNADSRDGKGSDGRASDGRASDGSDRVGKGRGERDAMIAALTTNVTRFFREAHHFEHLKTAILPPLMQQIKQGGKIRLWSAACSSGQEPYSMALTVLSLLPDAAKYDVKILATDIDSNMIAIGEAGVYDAGLMADIPAELGRRWFAPLKERQGCFAAGPELRGIVSFRKLNLIGDWPMQGKFHAIFCRNVVIYFDDPTKTKIWNRMIRLMEPAAALYIGHSERVGGQAEQLLRSDGITTYRPKANMAVSA